MFVVIDHCHSGCTVLCLYLTSFDRSCHDTEVSRVSLEMAKCQDFVLDTFQFKSSWPSCMLCDFPQSVQGQEQ